LAATVIIPARYASTRFPAKILASATGRPLVQHVVDQVNKCKRVTQVIVATDDQRIASALKTFETDVRMTATTHQSGTDRIWEVASASPRLDHRQRAGRRAGDRARNHRPPDWRHAGQLPHTPHYGMATAATRFPAGADPLDPNLVKVVIGEDNQALYFSRAPIPYPRDRESSSNVAYHLHLGIYAYTWDFLKEYVSWNPTPLEQTEKLEQLRALEHGRAIYVLEVDRATHGIDTPEQYEAFVRRMKQNVQ
jgi:3-deoxy-manno-octulosonate cytidylyltransferase (CMP-KDO synthetase)